MAKERDFVPMKVVLARKDFDYRMDPTQGGSKKVFEPVTPQVRQRFIQAATAIETRFAAAFKEHPEIPAVAKVELRPEASAKSHRPGVLFNENTCPIIGVDSPGELLVSVSKRGLVNLRTELRGVTQKHEANISTLKSLLPFDEGDVLEGESAEALSKESRRTKTPLRVRLFRHDSDAVNATIDAEARQVAKLNNVELEPMDYGEGIRIYAVRNATPSAVRALSGFVGTQSVGLFPEYGIVRTASHVIGAIDNKRFPMPDPNGNYGIVGIIDSGTDPKNKLLQAYVIRRDDRVKSGQNNHHGSFVAGLIANARSLNGGNDRFPSVGSRIVDVVAIDDTGRISEFDLVTVIDAAVRKHKDVRVWNISLGTAKPCVDRRFSLLGCKLDSIAKRHGVLFVVAAGNYQQAPLRGWPPSNLAETDRICPPADSVRSLTVGSLAHLGNKTSCVNIDEPSGFTRRGPAPHFYIKPEVSHYGGNCDASGDCLQTGVVSIDGKGNLAEDVGTSFATPNVATIAANVFRELEPDATVTPTLVKGLLSHSAFIRSGRPTAEEVRYRGFGSPGDLPDIINCTKSSATVIFHAELTDRQFFEKHDFPMPKCLIVPDRGLRAEVFMTLAYDPPTDARYGVEYCRSNVTASLGTVVFDPIEEKDKYTPQLRPAPLGITTGYEAALVSEGFKWSPLKFYHRHFDRGPTDKRWRLHLEILNRDGVRCKEPQKLVLFVTIRDPDGKQPVYDQMVAEMEKLSWGAVDLQIASRVRQRQRPRG